MPHRLLLALALAAGVSSAAQAQVADVVPVCGSSSGVATPVGTGGRLTRDVNGSLCVAGISGGSGGGGTGGTVTQGAAAPDTAGNRWPVLAYQGGTWSFGLSGPIPAGTNVIGAVTQSGGPWTVSGTVAATQSGTWTVGQGAAGATAWKVDGSGVTQPVSAASLPLPTGAATAANQNVTSAGTSATSAQAVQGVTGGVALPISASALPLPAGAATSANQSSEIAALGAPADTAYAGSGSSSIVAALKGVYNALLAPTPTGSNVIGSTTLRSAGTNRSANVTTTAANLMAANTSRQGWKIKNDCTVAVWINFDGTASAAAGSGNFQIAAGAYMASEPGFVETGAMSAIAASGTCALTVREH